MSRKAVIWLVIIAIIGCLLFVPRGTKVANKVSADYLLENPYIAYVGDRVYPGRDSTGVSVVGRITLCDVKSGERITFMNTHPVDAADGRIAFSRRGKIYYTDARTSDLWEIDLKNNTNGPTIIMQSTFCLNPAVSPDGRYVYFEGNLIGRPGYRDVFRCDLDGVTGNRIKQLTSGTAFCGSPNCSPDGKHIFYDCRDGNGDFSVWVMDTSGANQRRLIYRPGVDCQRPCCSPSGKWIVYQSDPSKSMGIFAAEIDLGGNPELKRIATIIDDGFKNQNPSFTPDGSLILYQSKRESGFQFLGMDLYDFDALAIKFNPDLQQSLVVISARRLTDECNPCWMPQVDDSTRAMVGQMFKNNADEPDSQATPKQNL
jgi:Tol biopolymer transport system component